MMALCWNGAPSCPIWSRPPSVIRMFSACSSMSASSNTNVPPERKKNLSFSDSLNFVQFFYFNILSYSATVLQILHFHKHCIRSKFCTLNKQHFEHWCVGVQQDGLAFSNNSECALLWWRQTSPRELGRPHVNVKEICVVLKNNKKHWMKICNQKQ